MHPTTPIRSLERNQQNQGLRTVVHDREVRDRYQAQGYREALSCGEYTGYYGTHEKPAHSESLEMRADP